MSKYRLSYLNNEEYVSIDLSRLKCLKGKKITDLKIINEFTTSFDNGYDLLEFLKRNNLINTNIDHLYITIDKKIDGKTIKSKIYKGEYLLFKKDKVFLDISFIYKWFLYNQINNPDLLIKFCDKSINKYNAKAKNDARIDIKTVIILMFEEMRKLIDEMKDINNITFKLQQKYDDLIDQVFNFEFYIDKEKNKRKYKNIHDFVIFLKTKDPNLYNYKFDNLEAVDLIFISDNSVNETIKKEEEFLTEEEMYKMYNEDILIKIKK